MNALYIFLVCSLRLMTNFAQEDLTDKEIKAFVDGHNSRRYLTAKGRVPNQPAGKNMHKMSWDDELYAKASAWAAMNQYEHNPDSTVPSGRFLTGENLYWYSTNDKEYKLDPDKAIESWFSEHVNYTFGPLQEEDFDGSKDYHIGHYTQLVWSSSVYIGCGISHTKEGYWNKFFVVCNYGPGGNYVGAVPYQARDSVRASTYEVQVTDEE